MQRVGPPVISAPQPVHSRIVPTPETETSSISHPTYLFRQTFDSPNDFVMLLRHLLGQRSGKGHRARILVDEARESTDETPHHDAGGDDGTQAGEKEAESEEDIQRSLHWLRQVDRLASQETQNEIDNCSNAGGDDRYLWRRLEVAIAKMSGQHNQKSKDVKP